MSSMRQIRPQSGKISLLGLAVLAIIGMILASLFFAKEDPKAVGAQFMDALARHDVEKLTSLSYTGETDTSKTEVAKKELHAKWDFCVNVAGQHFPFLWKVANSNMATENEGSVTVMVTKGGPMGYEEKYELPLQKEGGKWVVRVSEISRTMFPGLPSN